MNQSWGRWGRRKGSVRHVAHRLSPQERQQIMAVCNEPQYASLPPAQIVPALADQGEFLAPESSFYRVLHAHQQVQRRGRARPPQQPRPVPRRRADVPNQLWSWDITYLPPACGACGSTSTWWSTSGAAYLAEGQRAGGTRSSPGTSRTARTPRWPLI